MNTSTSFSAGKKIVIGIIAVLLIGAGLWFYSTSQKEPEIPKYTGPIENIIVSHTGNPDVGLLFIAEEEGFFEQEGLSVTLEKTVSGKASLESVLAGDADFGVSAETPIVHAVLGRQDVAILARIFKGENTEGIIARKDHGINTFGDLRGKTVGLKKGTSAEFVFDQFRVINALEPTDVTVVDVSPDALLSSLTSGAVDAVAVWQPILSHVQEALGSNAVVFNSDGSIYTYKFYLIARQDFVNQNKELTERFVRALGSAEKFMEENRAGALEIIMKETNIDRESLLLFIPHGSLELSLPQVMIIALENQSRWAIGNGLNDATKVPNYLDYIYFDALEAEKPEAVTIVK